MFMCIYIEVCVVWERNREKHVGIWKSVRFDAGWIETEDFFGEKEIGLLKFVKDR